jgi:hypothetical protein
MTIDVVCRVPIEGSEGGYAVGVFCPRCGGSMGRLSQTDRILECEGCGHLGMPSISGMDNAPLPLKLGTLLKSCRSCESVMLADDLFCRTCGSGASNYS